MKRLRKVCLVLAMLALLTAVLAGCDPCGVLYGIWKDDSEQMTYTFGQKGSGYVNYIQFPLEFTYEFDGTNLTIKYSETISETYKLTFYGDYEFDMEQTNDDGTVSVSHYTRDTDAENNYGS